MTSNIKTETHIQYILYINVFCRGLTAGLHAFTQLGLHFSVGPFCRQVRKFAGHCGGGDDGLEAAFPFGDVLLGMEDDDVDLGNVEHAQRHGGAEAEGHCQRRRLNVHLRREDTINYSIGGPLACHSKSLNLKKGIRF